MYARAVLRHSSCFFQEDKRGEEGFLAAFWRQQGGNTSCHDSHSNNVVTENVFFTSITTYLLRRKEKKTHTQTRAIRLSMRSRSPVFVFVFVLVPRRCRSSLKVARSSCSAIRRACQRRIQPHSTSKDSPPGTSTPSRSRSAHLHQPLETNSSTR